MTEQTTRHCTGCEKDLPYNLDFFAADRSKSSGMSSRCRKCKNKVRTPRERTRRTPVIRSIKAAEERERRTLEKLAYENACDQLVKVHPRLFASLLYSEHVRLGLVQITAKDIPADMRRMLA